MADLLDRLNKKDRKFFDKDLEILLVKQINAELYNSLLYCKLADVANKLNYSNTTKFFVKHGQEELTHYFKIMNYVLDRNGCIDAGITSVTVESVPSTLSALFEAALTAEIGTTATLSAICDKAYAVNDKITIEFLRDMIKEQQEEEQLFIDLTDELSIIGTDKLGLYLFDKHLK